MSKEAAKNWGYRVGDKGHKSAKISQLSRYPVKPGSKKAVFRAVYPVIPDKRAKMADFSRNYGVFSGNEWAFTAYENLKSGNPRCIPGYLG